MRAGWILPLLALVSCKNDLDELASIEIDARSPDRITTQAEYYYSDSGHVRNRLRAGRVEEYLAQNVAAFFRRDTWHHAFNQSAEPLRVLELFAPPPSKGTSGAYARTRPNVTTSRYTQDQWLGRWPMDRDEAKAEQSITVLRESDLMWRLEGETHPALVGLWVATEHLTVGQIMLQPGQQVDAHTHGGDESLYVLDGVLNVRVPENNGQRWFELNPRDGFYVPGGVTHQYYNVSNEPVRFMFGVAPLYLATSGDAQAAP
jgi:quercetin dioxygenase-like cupin family protein